MPPFKKKQLKTTYLGFENIKRAGTQHNFTEEETQEYLKCSDDPIYFINKYAKVVTLDYGIQPFSLYDYQEEMIKMIEDNRFLIFMLARQVGKTATIAAGYILWLALFREDQNILILANTGELARDILTSKIYTALEEIPFFLQPGVREMNKGKVRFENGSQIVARNCNPKVAGRGNSYNLVYLDEFAFVENADKFYTSVYPVISAGNTSKIIITSTPNGMNLFHRIYMDSIRGRNDFKSYKVTWDRVPGRDEKWKEMTIKNTSKAQFAQEHECKFMGATDSLLDANVFESLIYDDPLEEIDEFKIYEYPKENCRYVAISDTGRGLGGEHDYSAVEFIKIYDPNLTADSYKFSVVATYRSHTVDQLFFPELLNKFGKYYNYAHILIELNDLGEQAANALWYNLEYENLIWIDNEKDKVYQKQVPSFGVGDRPGVTTSTSVKRIGCKAIKTIIEKRLLGISDNEIIEELSTFTKQPNGSYKAAEGKHDDMVMPLVIFGWLTTTEWFKEMGSCDIRHVTINKERKRAEEVYSTFVATKDRNGNSGMREIVSPEQAAAQGCSWLFKK